MKTIKLTQQEALKFFKTKPEPDKYVLSMSMTGGLVVGGFGPYGIPIPGKQEELYSYSVEVEVLDVEDYYFEHGNGD